MVEAMATGTPVIAMRSGSTPEVVVNGFTGFVCDAIDQMIAAIDVIPQIDRCACRMHVERHFSAQAMADGYERVYRAVIEEHDTPTEDLLSVPAMPESIDQVAASAR
jgi:glycosyltransferase involved in cell wall biosynthesis